MRKNDDFVQVLLNTCVETMEKLGELRRNSRIFSHQRRAKVNGDNLGKYGVSRCEHFCFSICLFVRDRIDRGINSSHRLWKTWRNWASYGEIPEYFAQ